MTGQPAAPVEPADAPAAEATASEPAGTPTKPSARRALSRSLGTTFAAQLLMAVSGIELARGLGYQDRGALAAAMVWPTVIAGISTLGLTESLTYHIAGAPERVGRLVGSGLALAALQSVAFGVFTAAVVPLALSAHDSEVVTAGLVYALNVPLFTLGVVFLGTLNGLHRYTAFSVLRLFIFASMFVAQTILLIVGHATIVALAAAFVGCQAATTLLGLVLLRRARIGRISADRAQMREIFRYGLRSSAGSTSSFLNQRLDQMVISAFMSAGQLGRYVVAVNLTSVAGLIGNAVAYAALPNVAGIPEGPQRVLMARRLVGLSLLLSTALALPVIVLAHPLVHLLFGAQFLPAAPVARLLALGAIVFATSRALEAVLRAIGRPLDAGLGEIFALGGTFAGLAALLPLWGITGAAATSAVAYGISGGWMVRRAARALDTTPLGLLLPDRAGLELLGRRVRAMIAR
jgi:O-antigen/teichoic acid export membrane protein